MKSKELLRGGEYTIKPEKPIPYFVMELIEGEPVNAHCWAIALLITELLTGVHPHLPHPAWS